MNNKNKIIIYYYIIIINNYNLQFYYEIRWVSKLYDVEVSKMLDSGATAHRAAFSIRPVQIASGNQMMSALICRRMKTEYLNINSEYLIVFKLIN